MGAAAGILVGAAAGAAAGVMFFGGLLWTVRRLQTSARPEVLAGVSLLARLAAAAGVLVVLALTLGGPGPLLAALVGMLTVRQVLLRRARAGLEV